jgi:GNAT superfamily N-acetyltransferase
MSAADVQLTGLEFHPLTSTRWADLGKLFGARGACGGCWCMWWRISRSQFMKQRGEENRKAFKSIVDSGDIPGIVAYLKEQPIGWCAVAPRKAYLSLERSRLLKRVDDKPVWSVVCFFVAKPFRHKGLTVRLLEAAVDYVNSNGGTILEGYPVESKGKMPDPFVYTGTSSAFRKAGFCEVLRRSQNRPIMRYVIGKSGVAKS